MLDSKALAEAITHPDLIDLNAYINKTVKFIEETEADRARRDFVEQTEKAWKEAIRRNT